MWPRRFGGVAVALLAFATACVRDDPAEPGVRAVTTDLQYQAIRERAAAPPNTVPAASGSGPETLPPFAPAGELGPVAPPAQVCPTASPSEHPDEDVPETVEGVPSAGTYLWQVNGGENVDNFTIDFPDFHRRQVDKVKGSAEQEEPDIRFETRERELSGRDPNPPFIRQTFEATSSGVTLTSIVREVPEGETRAFEPLEAILYLPLPVVIGPGDAWESQGIDLVSEPDPQTLTHRAFVKGRITIDTCGVRIRAWHVVAQQTFTFGGSSVTRRYEYGVATQFGGLVVYEKVESPCDEDPIPGAPDPITGEPAPPPAPCDPEPTIRFEANLGKRFEE